MGWLYQYRIFNIDLHSNRMNVKRHQHKYRSNAECPTCLCREAPQIRTVKSTPCVSKKNKTFHRKALPATFHTSTNLFDTCVLPVFFQPSAQIVWMVIAFVRVCAFAWRVGAVRNVTSASPAPDAPTEGLAFTTDQTLASARAIGQESCAINQYARKCQVWPLTQFFLSPFCKNIID